MKKAILIPALAVIAAISLAGCNSNSTDVNALQNSIQQAANAKLAQEGSSGTITSVSCVEENSSNIYDCADTASDGSSASVQVTVAPDGSWVSGPAS